MSVHAHCTGSERRDGANGIVGGIGVGGGDGGGDEVGGGNGDVDGDGDGDGAGTGTEVEASERTQDGSGDGRGDGAGAGTGVETRGRTQDENGDGSGDGTRDGDGNEGGIGEAKKHKKPHRSCRCDMGNGGDLGGREKKRRQEKVGSVAADPDNLENSKKAERDAQGSQGLSKNCTSRESVFPLPRLIRGIRNKYH